MGVEEEAPTEMKGSHTRTMAVKWRGRDEQRESPWQSGESMVLEVGQSQV